MDKGITIGNALLWSAIWFAFMLGYTVIDMMLWRKLSVSYARFLHTTTIGAFIVLFIIVLCKYTSFQVNDLFTISWKDGIAALLLAVAFYVVLDKGIDPVVEKLFPVSEAGYQETLARLKTSPAASMIHICILAPFIEEILIRGYVLNGLNRTYGLGIALAVSTLLFAILHFNMVQTISALICGIALGILYIRTGSISACILAHCAYNTISFFAMLSNRGMS